jgi:hypothetical protein
MHAGGVEKRYCPSCSNSSKFDGEVCERCKSVERNCRSGIARPLVEGYFKDHPMRIPTNLLKKLQNV